MRLVATVCAIFAVMLFAVACGGSDDKKDGGGILSGNQGGSSSTSSTSSTQAAPDTGKPSGGSTSNAALLDPCTLFTKDDATAALGQPVKDGVFKDAGAPLGQRLCFYGSADDKSANSVQVSVIQTAGMSDAVRKGGQTAKVLHDNTKSGVSGTAAPAAGIGQDAFISTTSIYVLKGDTSFSILLFGNGKPGDASHTNALKAAATKVAA